MEEKNKQELIELLGAFGIKLSEKSDVGKSEVLDKRKAMADDVLDDSVAIAEYIEKHCPKESRELLGLKEKEIPGADDVTVGGEPESVLDELFDSVDEKKTGGKRAKLAEETFIPEIERLKKENERLVKILEATRGAMCGLSEVLQENTIENFVKNKLLMASDIIYILVSGEELALGEHHKKNGSFMEFYKVFKSAV